MLWESRYKASCNVIKFHSDIYISTVCAVLILVLQIALIIVLIFIKIRIYINALLCMYNNVIHFHFYSTVQKQHGENKVMNITVCSYKPT
jgi:hypothetical protein